MSYDNNAQQGFTILELLVAMAFVGVVLVSLTNLFTVIKQTNRSADNYTIATEVAQQQMEKYRNTPYANIVAGTTDITTAALGPYPSLATPRSASITVTEVDPDGLKKLDVAVSYKDRAGTKNIQLSTYVSYKGVNK